jgi:hypothetical protein
MADADPAVTLRVFLASPGDVPEERTFVRKYLESVLPKDPLLPRRVYFESVSWDDPHAGLTMPADLTPQEAMAITRGGRATATLSSSSWRRVSAPISPRTGSPVRMAAVISPVLNGNTRTPGTRNPGRRSWYIGGMTFRRWPWTIRAATKRTANSI